MEYLGGQSPSFPQIQNGITSRICQSTTQATEVMNLLFTSFQMEPTNLSGTTSHLLALSVYLQLRHSVYVSYGILFAMVFHPGSIKQEGSNKLNWVARDVSY